MFCQETGSLLIPLASEVLDAVLGLGLEDFICLIVFCLGSEELKPFLLLGAGFLKQLPLGHFQFPLHPAGGLFMFL